MMSPVELDRQSSVKIDRWIEIDSEEWRNMDDNPDFTKKILKLGMKEPAFIFSDSRGRLWGKGKDGSFYPFHFEYGSLRIGYRISRMAAN